MIVSGVEQLNAQPHFERLTGASRLKIELWLFWLKHALSSTAHLDSHCSPDTISAVVRRSSGALDWLAEPSLAIFGPRLVVFGRSPRVVGQEVVTPPRSEGWADSPRSLVVGVVRLAGQCDPLF